MTVSIKQDYKIFGTQGEIILKRQQNAVLADLTALRAAFVALTAKMDADFSDVTNASVDYAASVDPEALTLVE